SGTASNETSSLFVLSVQNIFEPINWVSPAHADIITVVGTERNINITQLMALAVDSNQGVAYRFSDSATANSKPTDARHTSFDSSGHLIVSDGGKVWQKDDNGVWLSIADQASLGGAKAVYHLTDARGNLVINTDSKGVWIATKNAAGSYNAPQLLFDNSQIGANPSNSFIDSDGNLIIKPQTGLWMAGPRDNNDYSPPKNLTSSFPIISNIGRDSDGDIFFSSASSDIWRINKKSSGGYEAPTKIISGADATIRSTAVDSDGNLFFTTTSSVYKASKKTASNDYNSPLMILDVRALGTADNKIVLDAAGNIIISEEHNGVWVVTKNNNGTYATPQQLITNTMSHAGAADINIDSRGNLIIADGANGLWVVNKTTSGYGNAYRIDKTGVGNGDNYFTMDADGTIRIKSDALELLSAYGGPGSYTLTVNGYGFDTADHKETGFTALQTIVVVAVDHDISWGASPVPTLRIVDNEFGRRLATFVADDSDVGHGQSIHYQLLDSETAANQAPSVAGHSVDADGSITMASYTSGIWQRTAAGQFTQVIRNTALGNVGQIYNYSINTDGSIFIDMGNGGLWSASKKTSGFGYNQPTQIFTNTQAGNNEILHH
ncbi:MAG: hypothetical protein ORN57_01695, partial [Alphaproteobacteria bacterium]|nr:hypothetical protein [Alphaproteobacteria bacterium]